MIATKPDQLMKETDPYLAKFERFENETKQPSWLFPLRKAGIARFAELGFPTTRQEDWRFTNVAPIAKLPFRPVFNASADGVSAGALGELTFANLTGNRLVFVNGQFADGLSTVRSLPKGVRAGSLVAMLLADSSLLEKHLGRYVRMEDYAFAALNTAFFLDGAFIYVPADVIVPEPIQLVFVSTVEEAGATTHPRNLIVAEKQSQLTVVESYVRTVDAPYFTNAVTELVAEDDAVIEHVKVQDESRDAFHIATVHGQFGRRSQVNAHSFALGARLSRNNIRA